MKAHGEEDDLKAELGKCMKDMVLQKKQKADEAKRREEEQKNKPKMKI